MPSADVRKYFIVKHGLDAFEALPNYVWRTPEQEQEEKVPHRFKQVRIGDRWVSFAYTTSDERERPLSRVTGFYECAKTYWYGDVPPAGVSEGKSKAWLIEGKKCGDQPNWAVGVPPFDDLLGKSFWKNQAIVPITAEDFDLIRQYTLGHQFDTSKIPLLGREPKNEQEVLAIVVCCHKQLGIERIVRVHKAFPDLLVQFAGSSETVHVELEVYSSGFFSHGHDKDVNQEQRTYKRDDKPVTVLCWIDDNKWNNKKKVNEYVHQVYELQSLFREDKKMIWNNSREIRAV